MQPQIIHEAQVHRQHLRLKIPIQAEVDGVRYQVDDWSAGGFGVESVMTSRRPGERFPVKLIFSFEDFEVTMRFDARLVYRDQDRGRFGCAFQGLSRAQSQVLRDLIDAWLAGEVVSAGGLLQLCARAGAGAARHEEVHGRTAGPVPRRRLNRDAAWIGSGIAGLGLLILAGWGIEQRYLRGVSASAVVEAPVVRVRAPLAGRLTTTLATGTRVAPGAALGTLTGFDGTAVPLASPCDCALVEQSGLDGQAYPVAAPLFALVRVDQPLLIRARLPLAETETLHPGDRVEIRVPRESGLRYGQIERVDLRVPIETLASPDAGAPPAARLAQVLVRPDRPFTLDDFGALVEVRFR